MRGDRLRIHCRDNNTSVRDACRESSVSSHDAADFRADLPGVLQSAYQIRADITLGIPAANREDKHRIVLAQLTSLQPVAICSVPSVIVDTRCEFRDIVSGGVAFDTGNFAKVVDRVGSVAGTTSDSEEENAAFLAAHIEQEIEHALDGLLVDQAKNLNAFLNILGYVVHVACLSVSRYVRETEPWVKT